MSKKKKYSAGDIAKARKPTSGMLRPRPKKPKKPRRKASAGHQEIECVHCSKPTKLRGRIGRTLYYKCPNCKHTQKGAV